MTGGSTDRQEHWTLVARASFGIPESVGPDDARRILVSWIETRLQENGWRNAPHAIAEPMLDALIALGVSGDLDDQAATPEPDISFHSATSRDAAHRLLDRGVSIVDPEYLVFDTSGEYPPEIITVAQQVLNVMIEYLREHPPED